MSNWRDQYDRMKRWQSRIDSRLETDYALGLDPDAPETSDPARALVFFAFAQACYHFVDWLERDRAQLIRRTEADAVVARSRYLSLCRDICQGSKHAVLDVRNVDLGVVGLLITENVMLGGGPQTRSVQVAQVVVRMEDAELKASEFATACVGDWDTLLRARGLL